MDKYAQQALKEYNSEKTAAHPGDKGMEEIATRIFAKIKKILFCN